MMANFSSEDGLYQLSERFDATYCLSTDVSESDCSSSFSYGRYEREGASSSRTSSSVAGPEFEEVSGSTAPVHILLPVVDGRHVVIPTVKIEKPKINSSEVEMKERFAKLLLGEDMSGGGKGVCTALALSNAIANLSATVFGELWKLEPLAPLKKSMWNREMDWLLSVSGAIVELTPSSQQFPGGGSFEVMVSRQRQDLCINLPALKKLDAMLISILDGFRDLEFYYVDRGVIVNGSNQNELDLSSFSSDRPSIRLEEKWWLPFPKVSPTGLSETTRRKLQNCRNSASQILQAALAINGGILAEMEIPSDYLESLPKSGKACLGEIMHGYIMDDQFSPNFLLDYSLDISSEYTALDVANGVEAAIHVWKQKFQKQKSSREKTRKQSWGGKIKSLTGGIEKGKILVCRAESLLQKLKQRFPGLPQTALDMSKIQHNRDVGQAILESYSRVMESLAFNIIARIDDLLFVDEVTKDRAAIASASSSYETKLRYHGSISSRRLCDTPLTALSSANARATGNPWRRTHHLKKENSMDELRERLARFSFS